MENSRLPIFLNCFSNRKRIASSYLLTQMSRAPRGEDFRSEDLEDFRSGGLAVKWCRLPLAGRRACRFFGLNPSLRLNMRDLERITASSELTLGPQIAESVTNGL